MQCADRLAQLSVNIGKFWTPKPLLGDGLNASGVDVLLAERHDLQQGQGLLHFLERGRVLLDRLGIAMVHDDQTPALLGQLGQYLGGVDSPSQGVLPCYRGGYRRPVGAVAMRCSLFAFKQIFVLLMLILNAPTSYASLGEARVACGGDTSVPCEKQSAGGSLRGMSEDDGEATKDEAPEAAATEATPEVSSDEAAGEPSDEAEVTSDDAGDASSDDGSEEEESADMVDGDEEYEE